MSFKAVIFDWGGVVTDDSGSDFYPQILRRYGATSEQVDRSLWLFRPFNKGEMSEKEFWKRVAVEAELDLPDTINGTFASWPGVRANESILSFVASLKDAGYITAVLSNVIRPTYDQIKSNGGYGVFDYVFASCLTGYAKPDPEMYTYALKEMNIEANQCLFIDDQERCLAPAAELGMTTILGASGEQIIKDTKAKLGING
jgi:putative hydrolase of the HAD superfamily